MVRLIGRGKSIWGKEVAIKYTHKLDKNIPQTNEELHSKEQPTQRVFLDYVCKFQHVSLIH